MISRYLLKKFEDITFSLQEDNYKENYKHLRKISRFIYKSKDYELSKSLNELLNNTTDVNKLKIELRNMLDKFWMELNNARKKRK